MGTDSERNLPAVSSKIDQDQNIGSVKAEPTSKNEEPSSDKK